MIKLTLNKTFKSLEPFTLDLPEFVILTGLNGAGKTQLLQAIQNNQLSVKDVNGAELSPKKYVTSQTLSPNESTVVTKQQLDQKIQNLWNQIQGYQSTKKSNPNYRLTSVFGNNTPLIKLINKIAESTEKNIEELTADDIYQYYPLNDGLNQTDVFYQNFSSLFKRYQDKYEENEYRQYRNEVKGHSSITFLTDEEFISTYGEAPWDFVNKIIAEANLDYHINSPTDNHRDAPFELKLINNLNSAKIKFGDLSSGEKVLMSLALALYNSNFDIDFPKVLLMDEPDASLHPSMSKQFLEVIQNVFVEEKGVNVIMTTHSPSTVAIGPEDSIYVVNKSGVRVEKSSKDKALKILTSGVPSFSVNYENRRQIFVESPNDVTFFEKLYRIFSDSLHSEISLSFISSGESRTDKNGIKISNCKQVENITNTLRDSGNKFVWGIIDWDLKENTGNDFVKILGNKNRYSIESYVFDPILVGALLLRQKIIQKTAVGLEQNETYIDLRNFEESRLQKIAGYVISKVAEKINSSVEGEQVCPLLNGINITTPNWYLHHQGHQLEEKIIEAFPQLNEIKRNKEDALKVEIIDKIVDDLPELISVDILNVFKAVQK
ncbi:AAA family ATPase [Tenacibaculum mesophilum]|uniref:AAA family ATPase n=1 Tax=Tenacibaculum mesophilum TaxID=104268 RepID=UPI003F605744